MEVAVGYQLAAYNFVCADKFKMTESSWIEIDLTALDRNVSAFRSVLAGRDSQPLLCGVVKADAYGLGVLPIARRLVQQGVDMLAVFTPEQGRELVDNGIDAPMLVMGFMAESDRSDPLCAAAAAGRLHLAVHSPEHLEKVNDLGGIFGCRIPIHLHVDTGMSRGGIGDTDMAGVLDRVTVLPHVKLAGIWTHMASSDDKPAFTQQQFERFEKMIAANGDSISSDVVMHVANTFTTLRSNDYHCDMVRIGLGLYGFGPELLADGPIAEGVTKLAPIARWCSRVVHVRSLPTGTGVGYNQTCHLKRDSVLGVVPVGYGDGYHLSLTNKGVVALPELAASGGHAEAPVLGKVNMDQIVIDLTDLPEVPVGALVEVYSNDPASPAAVPALAALAGSHPYDMLTAISRRVPRRYAQ